MPGWIPPGDLRFDHGAADAAIVEIRLTRETVSAALAVQLPATRRAFFTWRGQTADLTEDWMTHHHSALESLVERLTALEAEINDAIDDAHVEQARRDRIQARWWQEWREEQALAVAGDAGPR